MYLSVAVGQLDGPVPQHVQVTETSAPLKLKRATKQAAVQDACAQAEAMQQSCEPIDAVFYGTKSVRFWTLDHQAFRLPVYSASLRA